MAVDKFPPHILKELATAGFVEVQPARSKAFTDRVIACDGLYDFAARVRALHRMHLLTADKPSEIQQICRLRISRHSSSQESPRRVLHKAGIEDFLRLENSLSAT